MEVVENENFDKILELVGDKGFFQQRFNVIFNFLLLIAVTMPNLNYVISLSVPEHFCHVPGRKNTNLTLDEWKSLTIPSENTTKSSPKYSSCKMYNLSTESLEITDCQFGWEYDTEWFTRTIVTQENWVCGNELHVAHSFAAAKIGDFLGTFIFGQLGDTFGRRPIFFITVAILLIGRCLAIFTTGLIWLFLFAIMLGNLATPAIYQSPLIIAMEISRKEDRALLAMTQSIGTTCGLCLMPLIMWIFRDWFPFMLLTSIPCGLFLFTQRWIIESPRWLAGKGKNRKCMKELGKISETNGKFMVDEMVVLLERNNPGKDNVYGFMSLFSNLELAKNTIILVSAWVIAMLIYYTLILNINNLGGNPFMNYFWQGLAELPASIVGKYSCDKVGRRWTHMGGFILTSICCFPIIFLVNDTEHTSVSSTLAVLLKFFITLAYYAVNLHAIEVYPTCVRQTGVAFGTITASAFATLAPYIVYLGTSVDLRFPYIIVGILGSAGALCAVFLPETLKRKLPETLDDARNFSVGQKIVNLRKNDVYSKKVGVLDDESML